MKKTIVTLLILAIAAVSCFAGSVNLNLNADVSYTNEINLKLYASKTEDENGTGYVTTPIDDLDIRNNGTVYFKVKEASNFNRITAHSCTLTLTVTDFSNSVAAVTDKVATTMTTPVNVAVDNITAGAPVLAPGSQSATIALTYAAYKSIANKSDEKIIASFNVNWDGVSNIPAGRYTSTVTLEFTAL